MKISKPKYLILAYPEIFLQRMVRIYRRVLLELLGTLPLRKYFWCLGALNGGEAFYKELLVCLHTPKQNPNFEFSLTKFIYLILMYNSYQTSL